MGTALTEALIKTLKAREKKFTVSESGLVLEVRPNGSKCWFARLYVDHKEYRKAIGTYPEVSLKEARKLARDIAPESVIVEKQRGHLFSDIYREWYSVRVDGQVSEGHAETIRSRAAKYILPSFGNLDINDINSQMVLKFLRKIESRGLIETTKRMRQIIGGVFRFAIACGYV